MNKTKLLSMLTAGAVVCTTFGTFAAWDNYQADTAEKVLTINNATDIQAGALTDFAPTSLTGINTTAPTYSSTVEFTLNTDGGRADKLTLTPKITDGSSALITDAFTVVIKDANVALSGNADTTITDGKNTYTIEVTPKDATHAGAPVNVVISAELGKQ